MANDWIESLVNGNLVIELPVLSLNHGKVASRKGSGTVSWEAGAQIRVQAYTDDVDQHSLFRAGQPGKLIPHDSYVSVEANTLGGWELETFPASGNATKHYDTPHVTWDFKTHGLEMKRSFESSSGDRVIRAVLGPSPENWIRGTETEVRNEYFGTVFGALDWLLAEGKFGKLVARRRSDSWFEILLLPATDIATYPALIAVARSFGFLLGRRVFIRGHEESGPLGVTRRLQDYARTPARITLLAPLGSGMAYSDGAERLLGNAVDFFLTDAGEQVGIQLFPIYDTG